jgi:hypothetical protein
LLAWGTLSLADAFETAHKKAVDARVGPAAIDAMAAGASVNELATRLATRTAFCHHATR